jgi:hypothetical protein
MSRLIQDSRLRAFLEAEGYQTVSFDTGYTFTRIEDADLYYTKFGKINQLEEMILELSLVKILGYQLDTGLSLSGYTTHRGRIDFILEQLKELPDLPGPKFVFVHLMIPHPPFVYDENGNLVPQTQVFTIRDGDHFQGSEQEYRSGYINQLRFTNQTILHTIDQILAGSKDKPIILLQGDHGPALRFDFQSLEDSCVPERFSILNAYYLPEKEFQNLYTSISPVNSFRILLNHYFGTDMPALPDKAYYSNWDTPYDFKLIDPQDETNCDPPG